MFRKRNNWRSYAVSSTKSARQIVITSELTSVKRAGLDKSISEGHHHTYIHSLEASFRTCFFFLRVYTGLYYVDSYLYLFLTSLFYFFFRSMFDFKLFLFWVASGPQWTSMQRHPPCIYILP